MRALLVSSRGGTYFKTDRQGKGALGRAVLNQVLALNRRNIAPLFLSYDVNLKSKIIKIQFWSVSIYRPQQNFDTLANLKIAVTCVYFEIHTSQQSIPCHKRGPLTEGRPVIGSVI